MKIVAKPHDESGTKVSDKSGRSFFRNKTKRDFVVWWGKENSLCKRRWEEKIVKMINGKFQSLDTFLNSRTTSLLFFCSMFGLLLISSRTREVDKSKHLLRISQTFDVYFSAMILDTFDRDSWEILQEFLPVDCRPFFALVLWVQIRVDDDEIIYSAENCIKRIPTFILFFLPLEIYFEFNGT